MARRFGLAAISAGVGLLCYNNVPIYKKSYNESLLLTASASTADFPNQFSKIQFSGRDCWDFDWDRRSPESLVDKKNKKTPEAYQESLKRKAAGATRHVIMVCNCNHQLKPNDDGCNTHLTPIGRQQGHLTGKLIHDLKLPIRKVYHSNMSWASETADEMWKHIPLAPRSKCDLLEDGWPGFPEPLEPSSYTEPNITQQYEEVVRVEAAFRRHFYRAKPDQTTDTYDVLVLSPDMIGYMVCRAVQLSPSSWQRFRVNEGSLTWISCLPCGRVVVRNLGDIGHLDPCLTSITTNCTSSLWPCDSST